MFMKLASVRVFSCMTESRNALKNPHVYWAIILLRRWIAADFVCIYIYQSCFFFIKNPNPNAHILVLKRLLIYNFLNYVYLCLFLFFFGIEYIIAN